MSIDPPDWRRSVARLHGTKFFLTWITALNRQDIATQLKERFDIEYLCICEEFAPSTGRQHAHGVIILRSLLRTRNFGVWDIQENGQTIHADVSTIVSLERAIAYVKKEPLWIEEGNNPLRTKQMEKREKMRMIQERSIEEIMESGQFSVGEVRNAIFIQNYLRQQKTNRPIFRERHVLWLWGETGSGKTRTATQILEELHHNDWIMLAGNLKDFFNGYDGQKGVLFDDLRSNTLDWAYLLQLLDGTRIRINIKGSSRWWEAETIIITAPVPPEHMFVNHNNGQVWDDIGQLLRRINEVRWIHYEETRVMPQPMSTETQGFINGRDSVLDRPTSISSIHPPGQLEAMQAESPIVNLPETFPDDPQLREENN